MSNFSLYQKPTWVPSEELANVVATNTGWVYTRPDGIAETIVAINNLTTKQKPMATADVVETTFTLGVDITMGIVVTFSAPITSTTLTSATVLGLNINGIITSAVYTSKPSDSSLLFTYTFDTETPEIDEGESIDSILVNSIVLNTGEVITLNHADYTGPSAIAVSLDINQSIPVTINGATSGA